MILRDIYDHYLQRIKKHYSWPGVQKKRVDVIKRKDIKYQLHINLEYVCFISYMYF
jgi:hypothetical protein